MPATSDQAEVAHVFRDKNLVSCPVVDDDGRLLGVIMVDDVVDVIDEEAEEDLLKMGGVGIDDMHADTVRTARLRGVWLTLNLATAILASFVIGQFEGAIEKIVALAVLMPIVASMGGNAGTQTVTVAVRALAMGELTAANAFRFVAKEAAVGGLNGMIFAFIMGAAVVAWYGDWRLGDGDRRRHDLQSRCRRPGGNADPARPAEIRRRSGRIVDRVPDDRDRRDRLPRLPRTGDPVPALAGEAEAASHRLQGAVSCVPGGCPMSAIARLAGMLVLLLAAIAAAAQTKVPSERPLEALVKSALLSLNDANLTGNYTVFHAKLSKPFRQQFTVEKLKDTFREFNEKSIDIDIVSAMQPAFTTPPAVDGDGKLNVKGFFPTDPTRVNFELSFIPSDGEWKLISINVKLGPAS